MKEKDNRKLRLGEQEHLGGRAGGAWMDGIVGGLGCGNGGVAAACLSSSHLLPL